MYRVPLLIQKQGKYEKEGEFGEIWVCSEANLTAFTNGPKGPVDHFAQTQFRGVIADGNPDVTYLRTGDLGFFV